MSALCMYHAIVPMDFNFQQSKSVIPINFFKLYLKQKPVLSKAKASKEIKRTCNIKNY